MDAFCRRHASTSRVAPSVLVERAQPHLLHTAAGTAAAKQVSALHLVDQLELLNTQQRDYDKRLADAVHAHPDGSLLLSFPGISTVIAGVMVGEMADSRGRFPDPGILLAEAGLAPVTRASGRTRQVRFRYAANKHLRHAIHWWMTVVARDDPLNWPNTPRSGSPATSKWLRSRPRSGRSATLWTTR